IAEGKWHIEAVKGIVAERPALRRFDRNYVSLGFIDCLERAGIKYLIRLRKGDYKAEIKELTGEDTEVEIAHTRSRLEYLKRGEPERTRALAETGKTRARIIKMKFGGGEEGALITNMTECGAWELKGLYRKRWGIEQRYHLLKNKLKFESVTGKRSIYVEQDFRAQVLVYNMVEDLIREADWKVEKNGQEKHYQYEMSINENIAIGLFKEQFIRLMVEEDDEHKNKLFKRLKTDMARNIVLVRKSQSAPRKWNYFNKYKCKLKPIF
ncbi:MAG: transposase, partial [Treponema sp.]|nr:transposase [Treponema sp.]